MSREYRRMPRTYRPAGFRLDDDSLQEAGASFPDGDHDGDTALLYSRVQALDVIVQVLLGLIKQNVGIGPAQLFLETVEMWVIPQIYETLSEDRDNARFIEGLEAAFAEYLPKYRARVSG